MQSFFEKKSVQWLLLLAVFFGTVAVIFVSNDNFANDFHSYLTLPPPTQKAVNSSLRVTIDFGNGKKRAFEGSVDSSITAGQALRLAAEAGGLPLTITLAGDITQIQNVRSQSEKQWRWYLNGQAEHRAILDVAVRGGDKILIKYE